MTSQGNIYVGLRAKPAMDNLRQLLGVATDGEAIRILVEEVTSDAAELRIKKMTRRHVGIKSTVGASIAPPE